MRGKGGGDVADAQADVAPGTSRRGGAVVRAEFAKAGANPDPASAAHGIAGVVGQVDQHGFKQAGVGGDRGEAVGQLEVEGDAFPERGGESAGQSADARVGIDGTGGGRLVAAKEEQTARHRGRAFTRRVDLLQRGPGILGQVGLGGEEAGVAVDHRQNVVEIPGDAFGETTEGCGVRRKDGGQGGVQPGRGRRNAFPGARIAEPRRYAAGLIAIGRVFGRWHGSFQDRDKRLRRERGPKDLRLENKP